MKKLDNETKQRLADYFDAFVLVELLGIETCDVIAAFEDIIEDRLAEIEELMEFKHG